MSSSCAADVIAYLESQLIAVVASSSPDGQPQASTVFYWINDREGNRFNFYFVTRKTTRKYNNILQNPKVAVVVGTAFEPNTVQIDGIAEQLEADLSLKNLKNFSRFMTRHRIQAMIYDGAFYPKSPFKGIEGKEFVVFRVKPTRVAITSYDGITKNIVRRELDMASWQ